MANLARFFRQICPKQSRKVRENPVEFTCRMDYTDYEYAEITGRRSDIGILSEFCAGI